MITTKGSLAGKISEKQSLVGTINKSTKIVFPETQEKQTTPTKQVQEIVPDDGIYALSKVTINPIPSEYIEPTGTLEINENGTYNVINYASADVNVSGGSSEYNTKVNTVIPSFAYRQIYRNITELPASLDVSNLNTTANMLYYGIFVYKQKME